MKKLTALLTAVFALAMVNGPAIAAETMGVDESTAPMATSSFTKELRKQLSPNAFGIEYAADGVSDEEFREPIDKHYGVAPAWEGRSEEPLTMVEKAEIALRKHLSPNAIGYEYIADGVREDEYRGLIDKHYGIAPAWEDRSEGLLGTELRKQLSPNALGIEHVAD